jgi:hypothetical protein
MEYLHEARSVEGFILQLAVSYVAHGYFHYAAGSVPEGKDPRSVDEKLLRLYDVPISKWARARRKRAGLGNVQYLRHDRFFVLLGTEGPHEFKQREGGILRDLRERPVHYAGYSVSFRGGHASVRIALAEYKCLKAYLLDLAPKRSVESLMREFASLPFEPYAGVRRQLLNLHRAVNRRRQEGGFEELPFTCLRLRRRIVKPFNE